MRWLLFLFSLPALAQTAGSAMPWVKPQFFTNTGVPASGYRVCLYAAGTNTPQNSFTTSSLVTPNTNPVVLDSSGRASIFFSANSYKVALLTPTSTTSDCITGAISFVWTQDNIANNADLLKASLAGNTGAGQIGFSQSASYPTATIGSKLQQSVSVLDAPYSAKGDCVADDSAAILAATSAGISKKSTVYFPAPPGGCYLVNNSAAALTISSPSGKWSGDGAASLIKGTSLLHPVLQINSPANFTIEHMGFSLAPATTTRCNTCGAILNFTSINNLVLDDLNLQNGNNGGIGVTVGDHLKMTRIYTTGLLANGTQIANVSDVEAHDITGINNGDATFEVDKYDSNGGHLCQNIVATNIVGIGGNTGILVDSCQHVAISDFTIITGTGTLYIAVGVVLETAVSPTINPDDVNISNGYIEGGGVGGCLLVSDVDVVSPPAGTWNASFSNIRMKNCANDGINIGDDGKTHANVTLNNISIDTTGTSATANLGKGVRLGGNRVSGANITVANAYAESFWQSAALYVDLVNLKSINPNTGSVSTNAYSISSGGSSNNLHTLVNGLSLQDSNVTSKSNIADPAASTVTKMFVNIDHQNVTGTGWSATTNGANTYTTIFHQILDNSWYTDVANTRVSPFPGYHIGLSNSSPIDFLGSDSAYHSSYYTSAGNQTVVQSDGVAGSLSAFTDHTGAVLFKCTDAGVCTYPAAFTGTKTAGSCVLTIVGGFITNVTGC